MDDGCPQGAYAPQPTDLGEISPKVDTSQAYDEKDSSGFHSFSRSSSCPNGDTSVSTSTRPSRTSSVQDRGEPSPYQLHQDSDTSLDITAELNCMVTHSVEDELRAQIDSLKEELKHKMTEGQVKDMFERMWMEKQKKESVSVYELRAQNVTLMDSQCLVFVVDQLDKANRRIKLHEKILAQNNLDTSKSFDELKKNNRATVLKCNNRDVDYTSKIKAQSEIIQRDCRGAIDESVDSLTRSMSGQFDILNGTVTSIKKDITEQSNRMECIEIGHVNLSKSVSALNGSNTDTDPPDN